MPVVLMNAHSVQFIAYLAALHLDAFGWVFYQIIYLDSSNIWRGMNCLEKTGGLSDQSRVIILLAKLL